jgi:hypothetical protein
MRSILVLGLLIIISACSAISVTSDYDPALDFTAYRTFAVFQDDVKGSALDKAPLIKRRVLEAVEETMTKKGLSKSDLEKADLIAYAFAATKDKIQVTDWGYGYGRYWRNYPYGRNIDVDSYTEASLVVDLVDNKSDELIWRGVGTGAIREDRSPEERTKAVNEAVNEILEKFPPQ